MEGKKRYESINQDGGPLMELTFTNQALEVLNTKLEFDNACLRLEYDLEGCGCVNDGVTHLVQVHGPLPGDIQIPTNKYRCYIPSQYEVYFDEHLKVDYSSNYKMFQLKSNVRMINPRMTFKTYHAKK